MASEMQNKRWQFGDGTFLPQNRTEQCFHSEIRECHCLPRQTLIQNRKECKVILIAPNETLHGQTNTLKAADVSQLLYVRERHIAYGSRVRENVMRWNEEGPKPVMEIVRELHLTNVNVRELTSAVLYPNVNGWHTANLRLLFEKVNGWHTADLRLVHMNVNGWHTADVWLVYENVNGWHTADLGLLHENVNGWHTADLRLLYENVNGWHTADLRLLHENVNGWHTADLRLLHENVNGWHTADLRLLYENVNGWHTADLRLLYENVNGWHTADMRLLYENVNGWHTADLRLLHENVNGWHTADLRLLYENVNGWHTADLRLLYENVNGWHTADLRLLYENVNGWHTADLRLLHENVNGWHTADLRLLHENVNGWHTADLQLLYENVNGWHTADLRLLHENVNGWHTADLRLLHENVNGWHTSEVRLLHENVNGWPIADLWLEHVNVNGWPTADLWLVHENVNGWHTADSWLVNGNLIGCYLVVKWLVHKNVNRLHSVNKLLLLEDVRRWHARNMNTTLTDLKSSLDPVSSRTEFLELFELKSFAPHAERLFMGHHSQIVRSEALQCFSPSINWEFLSAVYIADDDHTRKCILTSIALLCQHIDKHRILFERNEYVTKYRLVLYDEFRRSERENSLQLLYTSFRLNADDFLSRHQNACTEWSVIDSLPYLSFLQDRTDRKVNILAEKYTSLPIFLEQIFRSARLNNNHFNFFETELRIIADFNMITREVNYKDATPIDGEYPVMETTEHQEQFNATTGYIDMSFSKSKLENVESFRDVRTKMKLRLAVLSEMPSTGFDLSESTAAVNWQTATDPYLTEYKEAIGVTKYKIKTDEWNDRKKNVDVTFNDALFGKFASVRYYTSLPMDQLPVPRVDITVAFVPDFPPLMAIIDQIAAGKPPSPHVSMRYEILRFCTLRSYPTEDKPYLILLAAAGFYYASDGDGVVCYCCGIRRYNWTADDDPMKIHRRINPTCKFLTKNEEVNVRNEFNGPLSKSLMFIDSIPEPAESQEPVEDINNDWAPERTRSPAPQPQNESTPSKAGINTAMPKHSQYATKMSRIASFNGWPDTASHSPDTLADAGFFYAGYGDCVRCFYCGIGLRHWTQDDNPWIEHARWSKNCVFLKQKKGEEFLNLVELAVQYAQNNEPPETTDENQLPPQEIENILLSDAAQSVLEMGYQPRIIKKAIEQILRQDRQANITAEFLMEKVLEIEEADKPRQAPQVPPAAAAAAATATVGPTEGATCSVPDESANSDKNVKENNFAEKKHPTEMKKDEHQNKPTKRGGEGKEYRANDASHKDAKAIKAENEQLKEQTLCKVCLDQTVSIVFLPCGHLVTCADCAPAMRECPICRAPVKGTVKTYMA